jgi:tripartite-type tricarboxylate transporter receptor subunit TctC
MRRHRAHFRKFASALLCALAPGIAAVASAAIADESFPQRPIRVIVPFPPGSGTDIAARVIGGEITKVTRQPVIVENKAGANGFVAAEVVAKAAPDGYTVLMTSNTHIVNKLLFKKLPYDPIADFKSVTLYKKTSPLVLVVAADSPYRSVADLTARAKAEPGKLTYASGNSSSRVGAEWFKQLTGTDLLYVPYKGNPEALTQVAAGRVDIMFSDSTSFLPLYRAGKLRALLSTGPDKLPSLKSIPTAAEAGLPELNIGSWAMYLVPRQTPDAIADRLHDLVHAALKTESVQRLMVETNAEPDYGSRADLDRFMQSELVKWGTIIRQANIQPE